MNSSAASILSLLLAALAIPVPAHADANFSQYPGFAEYFAAHPRHTQPASAEEQALLTRYRPRLWVAPQQEGPISFYRDYIAHGRLLDGRGGLISAVVTPKTLNAHREDASVIFAHQPASEPATPSALGRVDREAVLDLGEFRFLTWHFVFRYSGLAAGLRWWQSLGAAVAGDRDDWHQLDHYTAATLALDPQGVPVGLILQQHNGLRTYWLGTDLALPADGRLRLCAARRSNELYPCASGQERHRVVSFMTPESLSFLVAGTPKPWLAAEDLTEPAREVEYGLDFLPPSDAFYCFAGYLGERRRFPGREGPPGADYYAPPRLLSRALQLMAFRWRENDLEQMRELSALLGSETAAASPATVDRFKAQLRASRSAHP